jgi:hypothetical protein
MDSARPGRFHCLHEATVPGPALGAAAFRLLDDQLAPRTDAGGHQGSTAGLRAGVAGGAAHDAPPGLLRHHPRARRRTGKLRQLRRRPRGTRRRAGAARRTGMGLAGAGRLGPCEHRGQAAQRRGRERVGFRRGARGRRRLRAGHRRPARAHQQPHGGAVCARLPRRLQRSRRADGIVLALPGPGRRGHLPVADRQHWSPSSGRPAACSGTT